LSYKFQAYFNDSGISQTAIYSYDAGSTYTYNYLQDPDGDGYYSKTMSGFSSSLRFTATAASGYSFYRWVYRLDNASGTVQYSYSNPFTYSSGRDIYIRAESQSSGGGGGGGGGSSWTQTTGNIGTVSSTYTNSFTINTARVNRYSVKFTNSGTATFETSGSLDTVGYLSTSTGFDSDDGVPTSYVAYDDDSGSGNNFKISYSVSANTTYYIWMRCYSSTSSGSTTLTITPPGGGSSDIQTYTWTSVSSAKSQALTISAGGAYRFKITFAKSGSATFYTTGSSDTYGYLSASATWDSSSRAPSTYLKQDDDSGDGNNFSIKYDVTAGTTYYVYVRLYSNTVSGSTTFCITPPSGISKWTWSGSNGNASASVTSAAYNSLYKGGKCSDFSYLVWNDMCDKVKEILDSISTTWSTYYGLTLVQTKMSASDKTLTAARFNSLRYNIGSRYSTGIDEVKKGDTVYASYFITLATKINGWIDSL